MLVVLVAKSLDDLKEYVESVRCVFYRVLENEVRVLAGRIGIKLPFRNEYEKKEILEFLKQLKETKRVIEITDVTDESVFFL